MDYAKKLAEDIADLIHTRKGKQDEVNSELENKTIENNALIREIRRLHEIISDQKEEIKKLRGEV